MLLWKHVLNVCKGLLNDPKNPEFYEVLFSLVFTFFFSSKFNEFWRSRCVRRVSKFLINSHYGKFRKTTTSCEGESKLIGAKLAVTTPFRGGGALK